MKYPSVKKNNFIAAIICFALVSIGVTSPALYSMSWAQDEKRMQNATVPVNLTTSNQSAQAQIPNLQNTKGNVSIAQIEKANTYINNSTAIAKRGSSNITTIFCDKGDTSLSGGYSVTFERGKNLTNLFIYANHPTGNTTYLQDPTSRESTKFFQEGWEAGLLNNGNEDVRITAVVLCANVFTK
jgi:hypothetical protein